MGIYGGDDGLTADVKAECAIDASRWVGQALELEPKMRGVTGVKFLSRIFGPEVWFGNANSMCDVSRQLAKLHTSKPLPGNVSQVDKLIEKMRSYWLMDRNTPVIGEIATAVLQSTTGIVEFDPMNDFLGLRAWMSLVPLDEQFPNEREHWMWEVVDKQLPMLDHAALNDWLKNPCLEAPCVVQTRPASEVVVVLPGVDLEPSDAPTSSGDAVVIPSAPRRPVQKQSTTSTRPARPTPRGRRASPAKWRRVKKP